MTMNPASKRPTLKIFPPLGGISGWSSFQRRSFTMSVLLKSLSPGGHFYHLCLEPSIVAKRLARHFVLGRSRVRIPGPPDLGCGFFQGFSHIITSCIHPSEPTTFLPHPASPYSSRIFLSVWLKRLKEASTNLN
ncbi:hypothetical protein GEV33_004229 [Tenebrio molitor]|uniref:Uncharacterized protein n=1 Tax=Tenebrio molitor TaxID=7067 RepID=A0A8J6HQJ6_TENMO|nr:hypothetical protein GEV33_004229 [Tenebrio molitor]